ncbi:MFS transporter, putative metabolite transport protein [Pseudomonas sp. ok272]|uniref:MFS transporter n=1 Tax=unclassified Pseudomonas TaxID=196821 RepID=UPI0008BC2EB3|nr:MULTISPECIES: MFS transporter [unclassified Pseudomonas]SEN52392.1 MFS transporter, putative metabolite transport protein [Pseudomonas sp. ok272]SFN33112.1 MFS transporter, putative metabolite transport protein [Pseudomonas sp. ok602]
MQNVGVTSTRSFDRSSIRPLHIKAAVGGVGGQFCDGYVLGIIGIAIALATTPLGLDALWLGLLGGAALIGLFLGSLLTGPLADRFGRKHIYRWNMALFCVVSVAQFFAQNAEQLLVLRLLLGLALGSDFVVGVSLVAELVPKRFRGPLLALMAVAWTLGFTVSYVIGYLLQSLGDDAWRWILFSSAVPALLVFIARQGTPESPLWLMKKGRLREARDVMERLGGGDLPTAEANAVKVSWSQLFSRKWRRNTLVGAVFYTCQVIPYFAMSTFIPRIFTALKVEDSYTGGLIYNVFLLAGAVAGLMVINRLTRRSFLIGTFTINAIALFVLATWSGMPAVYVVGVFAVFAFVMAASGVLEFAYTSELFPTELRASGVGLSVAASRIGAAAGTFLLPVMMERFGTASAIGACVAALVIGALVCLRWAPETNPRYVQ